MSNEQDIDNLMEKFKDKVLELASQNIKVGIPKEFTSHDFSGDTPKKRARDERRQMARSVLGKDIQEKGDETLYLADIAFKNNFGSFSKNIPARPFGSTMVPRYKEKILKIYKAEINAYLQGKQTLSTALNKVGLIAQGYMQKNLRDGNWKANAPLTIFLKGSSKPLIDTGQMRQAITYIVEDTLKNE